MLCLFMVSCAVDPPMYHFDSDELMNDIVEVSFVRYYEQLPIKSRKGETPGIEVNIDNIILELNRCFYFFAFIHYFSFSV